MSDFKYDIIENYGVLSESQSGWKKELNFISWNEREPKYDIREWPPDRKKVVKGVSLNREEAEKLRDLLNEIL